MRAGEMREYGTVFYEPKEGTNFISAIDIAKEIGRLVFSVFGDRSMFRRFERFDFYLVGERERLITTLTLRTILPSDIPGAEYVTFEIRATALSNRRAAFRGTVVFLIPEAARSAHFRV